jgi:glycosyltransferase involved in cell wall biosynthesis
MSETPQISILVPVYNTEDYLDECLNSIVEQTYKDFEVICINDGSTDNSRDIIQSYVKKDYRFKLIDKENSGYGASMNRGLDEARGCYIAFLESDDFFAPEMLLKLHTVIKQYDAQVAKANCYHYWSTPQKKNTFRQLVPRNLYNELVDTRRNRSIFYLQQSIWSALYRREFLNDKGIRFLESPGASYQDTSFSFKVWFCAERAVFLPDALLHYRQDNINSSVNSVTKAFCVVDELHEIERFVAEHDTPDWVLGVITKLKLDTYLWNYDRLADELQLEFLLSVSKEFNSDNAAGSLDWSQLKRWDSHDLRIILDSPEEYHHQRKQSGPGLISSRLKHVFITEGLVSLVQYVFYKMHSRYYEP